MNTLKDLSKEVINLTSYYNLPIEINGYYRGTYNVYPIANINYGKKLDDISMFDERIIQIMRDTLGPAKSSTDILETKKGQELFKLLLKSYFGISDFQSVGRDKLISDILSELTEQNIKIVEAPDNGDCFFDSIGYQLKLTGTQVRKEIGEYAKKSTQTTRDLINNTIGLCGKDTKFKEKYNQLINSNNLDELYRLYETPCSSIKNSRDCNTCSWGTTDLIPFVEAKFNKPVVLVQFQTLPYEGFDKPLSTNVMYYTELGVRKSIEFINSMLVNPRIKNYIARVNGNYREDDDTNLFIGYKNQNTQAPVLISNTSFTEQNIPQTTIILYTRNIEKLSLVIETRDVEYKQIFKQDFIGLVYNLSHFDSLIKVKKDPEALMMPYFVYQLDIIKSPSDKDKHEEYPMRSIVLSNKNQDIVAPMIVDKYSVENIKKSTTISPVKQSTSPKPQSTTGSIQNVTNNALDIERAARNIERFRSNGEKKDEILEKRKLEAIYNLDTLFSDVKLFKINETEITKREFYELFLLLIYQQNILLKNIIYMNYFVEGREFYTFYLEDSIVYRHSKLNIETAEILTDTSSDELKKSLNENFRDKNLFDMSQTTNVVRKLYYRRKKDDTVYFFQPIMIMYSDGVIDFIYLYSVPIVVI